jgi:DNA-binding MarR family transcriptional regulator
MEEEDRRIRRIQARAEGRRLVLEMSEAEAEALDSQRHEYLSDWTDVEREKFKREQGQLWDLIPAEFRQKAERLARGGF